MRPVIVLGAIFCFSGCFGFGPAPTADPHLAGEYQSRRAALRKALADGVTVLMGRAERDEDLRTGFFQESNFYYLTGWTEPGAILVLAPLPDDAKTPGYAAKAALPREILFLPERNPEREKWTGRKLGPEDQNIREVTGFSAVMPAEKFEGEFQRALEAYARIYTLEGQPGAERIRQLAPLRDIANAAPAIANLRMHKSSEEIALIEHATDVTIEAHRAAWRRAGPGVWEYQVAAAMTDVYAEKGCERSAYAPIVGSGPNSVYLHYSRNSRRMDRGEVLLMDVGAECVGYAADVTRTIPVGGNFTPRQREIYDIVLGAQKAAIDAVKPGMTLAKTTPNSLYKIAYDYINTHGKDLHGEPLGKYFNHGIGHHVGLDVHDASDPTAALEPGMVITIEPGIYIPEENIGVRVEDMVLVTDRGARVLSAALPRDPGDIQKLAGHGRSARAEQ
ncbi:MAG TPA: Xaa-Pro peptidase family protein [Bryobacteraceae bacterium]|nr:Xaa-Pro peptidase family protein [Bryobacteraceae bacterium]